MILVNISGNFIHRHHVEPRVKLTEHAETIISYSSENFRRYQNNTCHWDVLLDKH